MYIYIHIYIEISLVDRISPPIHRNNKSSSQSHPTTPERWPRLAPRSRCPRHESGHRLIGGLDVTRGHVPWPTWRGWGVDGEVTTLKTNKLCLVVWNMNFNEFYCSISYMECHHPN